MYLYFSGVGLLLKLTCKKYLLRPEEDKKDQHFISYFDQKLYSIGQHPVTTDEYCLEYVHFAPNKVDVFFIVFLNIYILYLFQKIFYSKKHFYVLVIMKKHFIGM